MKPGYLAISRGGLITLLLICGVPAFSFESKSPAQLEREILDNLIAPCCWSQPVSQHYSEVADQIRREVHSMVAAGKSRREILDHFVAQYGERILAVPRGRGFSILGYLVPWAALIFGACMLFFVIKKRLKKVVVAGGVHPANERYISMIEKELRDLDR